MDLSQHSNKSHVTNFADLLLLRSPLNKAEVVVCYAKLQGPTRKSPVIMFYFNED